MTKRQETLLKELLETYITQAGPVSSAMLAKKMQLSSATVRNELAVLEQDGYLHQPHTSAGRMPTLRAYEFYLEQCLQPKPVSQPVKERLKQASKQPDAAKALAKAMADVAHAAVLLALNRDNLYYTGLSQLFSQPEFMDQRLVISLSQVLDVLDTVMPRLQEVAASQPQVLIGKRNPLGSHAAVFLMQSEWQRGEGGLCALLAPLRTDYNKHLGMLQFVQDLETTIRH